MEPFFSVGDGLRRMYLESEYDTVEDFLTSLECPDYSENIRWHPTPVSIESVTLACSVCGWELTVRPGDPPILHDDRRLKCPHY